MWLSILSLVFWFMHSTSRYGLKHKETILEVWKKEFQMLYHLTDFLAVIDKLISRIGKYTSSCVLIISIFIGSFSTYSEDPTDIFFSTLGGAWACQRQSCRIGRIFLLEWHEPVLASGSQNGSGDGRHQRGHDELSGSSIWRGQRVRPWKRGEQPVLFELQSALCISKKFRLWWYT